MANPATDTHAYLAAYGYVDDVDGMRGDVLSM